MYGGSPAPGRRPAGACGALCDLILFFYGIASRSLYGLRFADFIAEIAQMSIGNEYWIPCDVPKFPNFLEFMLIINDHVEVMINHHSFFATMFFLFENVPPKSWTPIFYFRCCCEVIVND